MCVRARVSVCVRACVCVCGEGGGAGGRAGEDCFCFMRGVTTAAFTQEGKMPVDKDALTMAMSTRTISSQHSESKDVAIGSRTHVLGDIFAERKRRSKARS